MKPSKKDVISSIEENKIIVIMRGLTLDELLHTVDAMEKGGIHLVEVTFDQSGKIPHEMTANSIKAISEKFAGRVRVGAGTVMTVEQLRLAYEAGAEFIISPDSCEEIIKETVKLGMVSIPGGFTPTECANAYRWGADFVKLFPNSEVKPSYLKALKAPLSHIKFLAVGGIDLENIDEYMKAGACGIGIATGIVNRAEIKAGEFDKITARAKAYVSKIKEVEV